MTPPVPVVEDFTIFEDDGVTPWYGTADVYGEVITSDFQTPHPDFPHDRPHLQLAPASTGTELEPLQGGARIGSCTVPLADFRVDAADQATGYVTARIRDARGRRAVRRRWLEDGVYSRWVKIMDGVVHRIQVDPSNPLRYLLELHDHTDYQRDGRLFFSNHVIFGADGNAGPAINYGLMPGGEYMAPAVQPYVTTFSMGLGVGYGYWWGLFDVPLAGVNLGSLGNATQNADGSWVHRDFQLWWRPAGSPDGTEYHKLRNMLRPFGAGHAVQYPNMGLGLGPEGSSPLFRGATTIFGSTDTEDDIPTDGQAVEILVLAVDVTPDTPFWWDGGTLGDLLAEYVAGDHTDTPPRERYDPDALEAFRLTSPRGRLMLTAPVTDRRRWLQENIYRPSFTVPAPNDQLEIVPRSWLLPTASQLEGTPVLDADTIQPVGDFQAPLDNAVGRIEFTYLREYVEPEEAEPVDEPRPVWRRLVVQPVNVVMEDEDAAPGAGVLTYAPVTIRSIAGADGAVAGGETQTELGAQLAEVARNEVFPRFRAGAAKYRARVTATAANLEHYLARWLRVDAEWLPEFSKGRRGLLHYMQVVAISEAETTAHRYLLLLDSAVPDYTGDPAVVDPDNDASACLTTGVGGGVAVLLPNGQRGFLYEEDGELVNTCPHPVTVQRALGVGGGGGGGITLDAGGGGGAGGKLEVETFVIGPGQTVPIRPGAAGAVGMPGGASTIWVDAAGNALDPLTDDPADAVLHALGGGEGDAGAGGSGGGASEAEPISGGGTTSGGTGQPPQGNNGGSASSNGGIATCKSAAGGGGGSAAEAGAPGAAGADPPVGGAGGDGQNLADWGVDLGGGGTGGLVASEGDLGPLCPNVFIIPGQPGEAGYGAGGGGHALGSPATPGTAGVIIVAFAGGEAPTLEPPVVEPPTTTELGQLDLCVTEANWSAVALPDYRVRVEYAVSETEPAEDSGEWLVAGYLDAPGCVTTPPLPVGAKVWHRARAVAAGLPPSDPSTPTDQDLPETPGLKNLRLEYDADGVATLRWVPNAYAAVLRIRGLIHDLGDSTDRPLPFLADVDAADGEYQLPGTVTREQFYTVDVEAYGELQESQGAPVVVDDFDNGGVTTTTVPDATRGPGAGGWVERGTTNFQLVADTLRMTGGAGTPLSVCENADVSSGEMFVQARATMSSSGGAMAEVLARYAWGAGSPDGYSIRPTVTGWDLRKVVAGVETSLDTAAEVLVGGTLYPCQLYVADGVQEASGNGQLLNAADTAHDGQDARAAGVKFNRSSGTPTCTWDDFYVFTGKHLTVSGLPTGWKAKVKNGGGSVVAQATESSGTALVDLSIFGGCTEVVPAAGWPTLQITDGADVEQAVLTGVALYPGMETGYNDDLGTFGLLLDEGPSYRVSLQRPAPFLDWDKLPEGPGTWDLTGGAATLDGDVAVTGDLTFPNPITYANLPIGDGTWVIGTSTEELVIQGGVEVRPTAGQVAYVVLAADGEQATLTMNAYRNATVHAAFRSNAARGSEAAPDFLTANNDSFTVTAGVWDGSAFTPGAQMRMQANATHSAGSLPMRVSFQTTPSGSATAVEVFRIGPEGNIGIGATKRLYLDGVALTGDTYLGESSANVLQFTTGGSLAMQLSSAGALFPLSNTIFGAVGLTPAFVNAVQNTALTFAGGDGITQGANYALFGPSHATTPSIHRWRVGNQTWMILDASTLLLGVTTANTNMNVGLTINQGGQDNQIFALRSSDVATGLSSITTQAVDTTEFLTFSKASAAFGGLRAQVMAEDAALATVLTFDLYGGTATGTKTTAGVGLVNFQLSEHDGLNALADVAATGNLVSIRARVGGAYVSRFLFDVDGNLYSLGSSTTRVGPDVRIASGAKYRLDGADAGDTYLTESSGNVLDLVAGGVTTLRLSSTAATLDRMLVLKAYTVATLPAGVQGARAYVTDATAPTFLGALVGGGAVVTPVFYNGAAWVSA